MCNIDVRSCRQVVFDFYIGWGGGGRGEGEAKLRQRTLMKANITIRAGHFHTKG